MLYDEAIELDCGIKIYGSPYSLEFCGWSFALKNDQDCQECYSKIPEDTDILMTHGPPFGILDTNMRGEHCGDINLLKEIQNRVKPAYHLFGHIHEAYGEQTQGETTFVNAAVCTLHYNPLQKPYVFDMKINPDGKATKLQAGGERIPYHEVVRQNIPQTIIYEDELCFAFHNINPVAKVHFQVIPKKPDGLGSLAQAEDKHASLIGHMMVVGAKVAK